MDVGVSGWKCISFFFLCITFGLSAPPSRECCESVNVVRSSLVMVRWEDVTRSCKSSPWDMRIGRRGFAKWRAKQISSQKQLRLCWSTSHSTKMTRHLAIKMVKSRTRLDAQAALSYHGIEKRDAGNWSLDSLYNLIRYVTLVSILPTQLSEGRGLLHQFVPHFEVNIILFVSLPAPLVAQSLVYMLISFLRYNIWKERENKTSLLTWITCGWIELNVLRVWHKRMKFMLEILDVIEWWLNLFWSLEQGVEVLISSYIFGFEFLSFVCCLKSVLRFKSNKQIPVMRCMQSDPEIS